jgi:hypothetical protein
MPYFPPCTLTSASFSNTSRTIVPLPYIPGLESNLLSVSRMTDANIGITFGRDSSSLDFRGRTIAHSSRAGNMYTYLASSSGLDGTKKHTNSSSFAPHISTPCTEPFDNTAMRAVSQELDEPLVILSDILPAKLFQQEPEPSALKCHENRRSVAIGIRNSTIILTIVLLHLAQLSYNSLTGITTGINWMSIRSQITLMGGDSIHPPM